MKMVFPRVPAAQLRQWILLSNPEDKDEIENLPEEILRGLYTDVILLGPAAAKVREEIALFKHAFSLVDPNQSQLKDVLSPINDMFVEMRKLMHAGYKVEGILKRAIAAADPELTIRQNKYIWDYAFGGPGIYNVGARHIVESLAAAWSVQYLDGTSTRSQGAAKKMLTLWDGHRRELNSKLTAIQGAAD